MEPVGIVVELRRQRRLVFPLAVVAFTALLAVVRLLSPVPPQPLWFVACFWLVGIAITAALTYIAYAKFMNLATELEKTNASLRTEIAERQRVEEELRASENRYRDLFENAGDLIAILTVDGIITDVNRGAEVLLGRSPKEEIGKHFRDFLTPAANARMEDRFRRFYAGEPVPSVFELELLHKDGRVVPVEVRARFIRDHAGNPIGIQTIHRDISARKALEQQRANFLAMLNHDIRNPLAVVLGYTEMLRDKARERGAKWDEDILARIESSALTVHSLVTNYLELSKIEAGQLTLVKESLAINDILRRVGKHYESEVRRRHLTLQVRLQEGLPYIEGDPVALERVFANLVHNALKFTPAAGRVTIHTAQHNGEVVVSVTDTGPGIASQEIPTLFERYRQSAATKNREGAGLGLFIVKSLVDAHRGRVEVESTPGVGTRISVCLPISSASH
jgi:PAS domain S-box-containing protein